MLAPVPTSWALLVVWLAAPASAGAGTAASARQPDVPLAAEPAAPGSDRGSGTPPAPTTGTAGTTSSSTGSVTPPTGATGSPTASPPEASGPGAGGFFGGDVAAPATPTSPASEGPGKAPPMPEIEDLPSRSAPPPKSSGLPDIFGPKDRKPVAGGGVGFFDPGKLEDTGPGGSAGLQVRGYVGFNFVVAQRTDTSMRNPETGTFDQLKTLPFFGGGAANLYVGAPVYSDVVYSRIAFEFISLPRMAPGGDQTTTPNYTPVVLMEAAVLEVNPFAWAKTGPRWFAEGFKITGGVFIVPFGLEDEEHDAPVRWWVTRPMAMSFGRIYPGSWIDIGATIKWKPTFGAVRPVRPIELDFGVINGDACTQTRNLDTLYRYSPAGLVAAPCEHQVRPVEVPRGDGSVLGITPDNNGNKSIVGRVQIRPIPALNLGGSIVWGKHPQRNAAAATTMGKGFPDTVQSPTWRVGAHLDLNLDEAVSSRVPLPHIRGEFVYGVDVAGPPLNPDMPDIADRRMLGGYAQIAQPLWRRKKTRLPGLIVQYRFDHADPDLAVPRRAPGGAVNADFADAYLYDETLQAHVVGFRFPVLPRFTLKAEYAFMREEGGPRNRLYNDTFNFQAVADF